MSDEIARLRALVEAATQGPWETEEDRNEQPEIRGPGDAWIALLPHQCLSSLLDQQRANARAIAAFMSVRDELLAVVEAVEPREGRTYTERDCDVMDALEDLHRAIREHVPGESES